MFSSAGASRIMTASYLPKMASATIVSLTFSFILLTTSSEVPGLVLNRIYAFMCFVFPPWVSILSDICRINCTFVYKFYVNMEVF